MAFSFVDKKICVVVHSWSVFLDPKKLIHLGLSMGEPIMNILSMGGPIMTSSSKLRNKGTRRIIRNLYGIHFEPFFLILYCSQQD